MELLERIEQQIRTTRLPLFGITLAAVPCPDTPLILTLHWHAFVREHIAEVDGAQAVAFRAVPSSALQVNDRWQNLLAVDHAALEAAWELGAWDIARAERPACLRPGADSSEAMDCLKAFGAFPFGAGADQVVVADAPDAEELLDLAARRGYLTWTFRPVRGGIWKEFADDTTLRPDGTREPPCPVAPIPPAANRARRTIYRFGVSERLTH